MLHKQTVTLIHCKIYMGVVTNASAAPLTLKAEDVTAVPVGVNGVITPLTLTEEGKLLWQENYLSIEKEVLGFSIEGKKIIFKAVEENNGGGICCGGNTGVTVRRRSFIFELVSEDSMRIWSQKIQEYIDSLETKHQLHAKEVAKSLDILRYDGVVCVSGDGILVEVVNGLLEREDWDSAIKMPLGVVPAGTGNGMAKSLLDAVGQSCTASNATLAIIRGHKQSLDVATISQGQNRFFSVLMLAWGLIADIDIESEKYRWMGSARIDYYAIQRIFRLRRYNGCIKFVAAPGYETYGEPANLEGEINGEVKSNFVQHKGYSGPALHIKDFNRKIEGPFLSVWLHNVPWGGEDALAAPDARLSDGYLDLVVIKDCPKLTLLSLMTEINKGGHVRSPHVLYFKVKAFVLEPGTQLDDPAKEGIIDVDGEVLARGKGTYKSHHKPLMTYDKIHIKVDQGLATVFSPSSI
ncbi:sphingosine kinase 2-like isoform X2 [Lycium ferocissimum]|uniref:sphingosine kinase 2-like isoform X2 n=1 Tax=Lycium ferocissimum TaxID=112874 RepID=UPI002815E691|nr:sphingosine kinase 2-like isoform X2 [Lycium ferocissimum]